VYDLAHTCLDIEPGTEHCMANSLQVDLRVEDCQVVAYFGADIHVEKVKDQKGIFVATGCCNSCRTCLVMRFQEIPC